MIFSHSFRLVFTPLAIVPASECSFLAGVGTRTSGSDSDMEGALFHLPEQDTASSSSRRSSSLLLPTTRNSGTWTTRRHPAPLIPCPPVSRRAATNLPLSSLVAEFFGWTEQDRQRYNRDYTFIESDPWNIRQHGPCSDSARATRGLVRFAIRKNPHTMTLADRGLLQRHRDLVEAAVRGGLQVRDYGLRIVAHPLLSSPPPSDLPPYPVCE